MQSCLVGLHRRSDKHVWTKPRRQQLEWMRQNYNEWWPYSTSWWWCHTLSSSAERPSIVSKFSKWELLWKKVLALLGCHGVGGKWGAMNSHLLTGNCTVCQSDGTMSFAALTSNIEGMLVWLPHPPCSEGSRCQCSSEPMSWIQHVQAQKFGSRKELAGLVHMAYLTLRHDHGRHRHHANLQRCHVWRY